MYSHRPVAQTVRPLPASHGAAPSPGHFPSVNNNNNSLNAYSSPAINQHGAYVHQQPPSSNSYSGTPSAPQTPYYPQSAGSLNSGMYPPGTSSNTVGPSYTTTNGTYAPVQASSSSSAYTQQQNYQYQQYQASIAYPQQQMPSAHQQRPNSMAPYAQQQPTMSSPGIASIPMPFPSIPNASAPMSNMSNMPDPMPGVSTAPSAPANRPSSFAIPAPVQRQTYQSPVFKTFQDRKREREAAQRVTTAPESPTTASPAPSAHTPASTAGAGSNAGARQGRPSSSAYASSPTTPTGPGISHQFSTTFNTAQDTFNSGTPAVNYNAPNGYQAPPQAAMALMGQRGTGARPAPPPRQHAGPTQSHPGLPGQGAQPLHSSMAQPPTPSGQHPSPRYPLGYGQSQQGYSMPSGTDPTGSSVMMAATSPTSATHVLSRWPSGQQVPGPSGSRPLPQSPTRSTTPLPPPSPSRQLHELGGPPPIPPKPSCATSPTIPGSPVRAPQQILGAPVAPPPRAASPQPPVRYQHTGQSSGSSDVAALPPQHTGSSSQRPLRHQHTGSAQLPDSVVAAAATNPAVAALLDRSDTVSSVKSVDRAEFTPQARKLPRPPTTVTATRSLDRDPRKVPSEAFRRALARKTSPVPEESDLAADMGAVTLSQRSQASSPPSSAGPATPATPSSARFGNVPLPPQAAFAPVVAPQKLPPATAPDVPIISAPSPPKSRSPKPVVPNINVSACPPKPAVPSINRPISPRPAIPSINTPAIPSIRVPDSTAPPVPQINIPDSTPALPQINIGGDALDSDGDLDGPSSPGFEVSGLPTIEVSSSYAPEVSISVPVLDTAGPSAVPSRSSRSSRPQTQPLRGPAAAAPTRVHPSSAIMCAGCDNPIIGRIVSAMGQRWHPDCFKCGECSELLEHVSAYEHDGKPYCHLDYHDRFAHRCHHCKTPIVDPRFITLNDEQLGQRYYHELHFFCSECGDPFLDPSKSSAPGTEFNRTSEDDEANETNAFVIHRGHPYCERCHIRLHKPKCRKCRQPIPDVAVTALDAKWHKECFVCEQCSEPFANNLFFPIDGHAFCTACFERMQ